MNWKLTGLIIGGYLGISYLRKRGAVTINKDDAAGKVLDDAANTGDKLAEAAGQVKDAVQAKVADVTAPAPAAPATQPGQPRPIDDDAAALAALFH